MKVKIIPILSDNYSYLIIDKENKSCSAIDPASPEEIIPFIENENLVLKNILNTHYHADHTAGNLNLKEKYKCKIYGPYGEKDKIPGIDIALKENDILKSAQGGNISLSLPASQFVSVGSGKNEGLFGIKLAHSIGPLTINTILSREQVKKSQNTFDGGEATGENEINDYNFIKGVYFFIDETFKNQFYPLSRYEHGFPSEKVYFYE